MNHDLEFWKTKLHAYRLVEAECKGTLTNLQQRIKGIEEIIAKLETADEE